LGALEDAAEAVIIMQFMRVSLVPAGIGLVVWLFSTVPAVSAGELSGPYANRLSQSDVVQIKAAVSKERSISHNVKKIEAVRPDKVSVQTTARTAVDEDTWYTFSAYKRAGAWTIDENSIQLSIEKRDFRTNGPTYLR
jgi:hypothetical protein